MDIPSWKTATQRRLTALAQQIDQLKATGGGILYGALATATIFPLVEAYAQAIQAQNYPMLMALGGLAASLGAIYWLVRLPNGKICQSRSCPQR